MFGVVASKSLSLAAKGVGQGDLAANRLSLVDHVEKLTDGDAVAVGDGCLDWFGLEGLCGGHAHELDRNGWRLADEHFAEAGCGGDVVWVASPVKSVLVEARHEGMGAFGVESDHR